MATIEVSVCDVCKDIAKDARRFRLEVDGEAVELDLCADDGATVSELMQLGVPARVRPARKAAAKKATPARRTPFRGQVMTMEQIEALKATAK